jgi:hypothetical protein
MASKVVLILKNLIESPQEDAHKEKVSCNNRRPKLIDCTCTVGETSKLYKFPFDTAGTS